MAQTPTHRWFGFIPCNWQVQSAQAQLKKRDVVTLSPMGSSKTLIFWIPLLFNDNGITILITLLMILRDKNVIELQEVNIPVVNLSTATATDTIFKQIATQKFWVIIVSPKRILSDCCFDTLWKTLQFISKLFSITFDEDHQTTEAQYTNDHPNIHLMVIEMLDPLNSMHDLKHIFKFNGDPPPPKFMVFCNECKETKRLCEFAQSEAPPTVAKKLVWFHSGISTDFQAETIENLWKGEIWGIFCTDAASMGLDLRDIALVIQWKYTSSLCTLWQHLGRAAQDISTEATGIYLVKPQFLKKHKSTSIAQEVPSVGNWTESSKDVRNLQHAIQRIVPKDLNDKEYEAAAMDAYINAQAHVFCCRKVSIEYFDNPQITGISLSICQQQITTHFCKINGVSLIHDQASWHYCDQWGSQIFDIIQKYYLPSANNAPPSITENPNTFATNVDINALPLNKPPHQKNPSMCCACGQAGHIALNRLCPKYVPKQQRGSQLNDENVVPSAG
ncbi:P-loop containing nucleoside triphosphate hydrolase protein [Suillus hirtellus]|nr:P-loop containing nucleoside triphosphate hydrolase protein [Suillus hirtellus]